VRPQKKYGGPDKFNPMAAKSRVNITGDEGRNRACGRLHGERNVQG